MQSIDKVFIDAKANKCYINIPLLKIAIKRKTFLKKLIDSMVS